MRMFDVHKKKPHHPLTGFVSTLAKQQFTIAGIKQSAPIYSNASQSSYSVESESRIYALPNECGHGRNDKHTSKTLQKST
jgi:hypothetical protein